LRTDVTPGNDLPVEPVRVGGGVEVEMSGHCGRGCSSGHCFGSTVFPGLRFAFNQASNSSLGITKTFPSFMQGKVPRRACAYTVNRDIPSISATSFIWYVRLCFFATMYGSAFSSQRSGTISYLLDIGTVLPSGSTVKSLRGGTYSQTTFRRCNRLNANKIKFQIILACQTKQMKPDKQKRQKTSISIDPDLWAEFKTESARRRIEPSEAVEHLIEDFLKARYSSDPGPLNTLKYSAAELHNLLDEVLAEGTGHVGAIAANLELLAFAVRFVGSRSFDEIRALRRQLAAATSKKSEALATKKNKSK
jgi:hypothetical protein